MLQIMDELPDMSVLSLAQKDALIIALCEQVRALTATVQMLKIGAEELGERLRKDSHNFSKPPPPTDWARRINRCVSL